MARAANAKSPAVKTIVLVRHGRIAWEFLTPIPGYALGEWRRGEDAAPLDPSYRPRPGGQLERLIRTAASLIASPLRRSLESARLLAPAVIAESQRVFRPAKRRYLIAFDNSS